MTEEHPEPFGPWREAAPGLSRRFFLQTAGGAAAALTGACAAPGGPAGATASVEAVPATLPVRLSVNGQVHALRLDPRVTLLDALRNEIGLTGTKKGCDRGQCGACTVLIDGRRINACLTLAVMQEGAEVTTIEGLGTPDRMHPMQAAFLNHDGFQCGYCTPGQICSAVAVVAELKAGAASAVTPDVRAIRIAVTDEEIRERMSGNICRCGAYPKIVDAVREVAGVSQVAMENAA